MQLDVYDCQTCRENGLHKSRCCWRDSETRAVQFAPDVPPLRLTHEGLRALLPEDRPLRYLMEKTASGGRMICPVPLAHHRDLTEALQLEADLDAWHVAPFEGATLDWPAEIADLLRHIRGMKGLIQQRDLERQEKAAAAQDGD